MNQQFSLTTQLRSPRYPLTKKNLDYAIRRTNPFGDSVFEE